MPRVDTEDTEILRCEQCGEVGRHSKDCYWYEGESETDVDDQRVVISGAVTGSDAKPTEYYHVFTVEGVKLYATSAVELCSCNGNLHLYGIGCGV